KSPTEVGRWSCRSGEHGTSIPASFRRAGSQLPATVRPTGTKKSPGLGVGASLDERKARGLGGLRDLPFAISTPIAPIRSPLQIVAHGALRADRHSEPQSVRSLTGRSRSLNSSRYSERPSRNRAWQTRARSHART